MARCVTCCPRCTTPWRRRVSAGHADALAGVVERPRRARPQRSQRLGVDARRFSQDDRPSKRSTREVRKLGQILSRDDGVAGTSTCAGSGVCVAGSTGSPACATPTLVLDPLTDAASRQPPSAPRSPPNKPTAADDRTLDQVKADALVGLITGARSRGRGAPEVSVLIDLDTLRDGLHDHSVCETSTGQDSPRRHRPPALLRRRHHPGRPRR